MDEKQHPNKLQPAPRTIPKREDIIGFVEMREDGLIEIKTWCTFGDIADFIMEQIEEKMYVNDITQQSLKRRF